MRMLLIPLILSASSGAFAQHEAHQHSMPANDYAGLQSREIKALSPQQVADLREGRGMGASLPAELNGVPGPLHVLQLSDQLDITPNQRAALERITSEMKAKAQELGAQILNAEADLDKAFATSSIDESGARLATKRIAVLQGELRATHLVAHLKTRGLLTSEQIATYNEARGYVPDSVPTLRR